MTWWSRVTGLGGECLATFKAPPGQPYRDRQIAQASALIEDFKAGRKTPEWGRPQP